ncbi:MAG: hypothetical protein HQ530_02150 [Parcubacteria group bacterium]|nr:hypothetical protein [Parcubacteria group bacterium]
MKVRLKNEYSEALRLRQKGFSLSEIQRKVGISKSTASLWLRDVELSSKAIKRLAERGNLGRVNSGKTRARRRQEFERMCGKKIERLLDRTQVNDDHLKMFCSLLYWCEGGKDIQEGLVFSNSDPALQKTYLYCLRASFPVKEEKFRVLLQLHEYHSIDRQIKFWSKVMKIPQDQFSQPYIKPHTGKRKRENYPGCVNVKYHDSTLAKEMSILSKGLLNKYGGVG